MTIGSLSTRVFETRTATGSELFSLLTCLHTTAFALPSIFSPLKMLGIKIWETPLSWHAKCPLPVVVRVSKTCVLKLPNVLTETLRKKSAAKIYNAFDTIPHRFNNYKRLTVFSVKFSSTTGSTLWQKRIHFRRCLQRSRVFLPLISHNR